MPTSSDAAFVLETAPFVILRGMLTGETEFAASPAVVLEMEISFSVIALAPEPGN